MCITNLSGSINVTIKKNNKSFKENIKATVFSTELDPTYRIDDECGENKDLTITRAGCVNIQNLGDIDVYIDISIIDKMDSEVNFRASKSGACDDLEVVINDDKLKVTIDKDALNEWLDNN